MFTWTPLSANNLLGTISLPMYYTFGFSLNPTGVVSGIANLLHLSAFTTNSVLLAGASLPSVFFSASSTQMYVDLKGSTFPDVVTPVGSALPLASVSVVQISVLNMTMIVSVTGAITYSQTIAIPYRNALWPLVYLYASDPWNPTANVQAQNVFIALASNCVGGMYAPIGQTSCNSAPIGGYALPGSTTFTLCPAGLIFSCLSINLYY